MNNHKSFLSNIDFFCNKVILSIYKKINKLYNLYNVISFLSLNQIKKKYCIKLD